MITYIIVSLELVVAWSFNICIYIYVQVHIFSLYIYMSYIWLNRTIYIYPTDKTIILWLSCHINIYIYIYILVWPRGAECQVPSGCSCDKGYTGAITATTRRLGAASVAVAAGRKVREVVDHLLVYTDSHWLMVESKWFMMVSNSY